MKGRSGEKKDVPINIIKESTVTNTALLLRGRNLRYIATDILVRYLVVILPIYAFRLHIEDLVARRVEVVGASAVRGEAELLDAVVARVIALTGGEGGCKRDEGEEER